MNKGWIIKFEESSYTYFVSAEDAEQACKKAKEKYGYNMADDKQPTVISCKQATEIPL